MKLILTDKVYDKLKWVCQILVPAIATLYFGIAEIWHWGHVEEIVGTLTAIDAFMGVLLGIASSNYQNSKE